MGYCDSAPIDEGAISIFTPSPENVASFNINGEQYLAIGLQEKEVRTSVK